VQICESMNRQIDPEVVGGLGEQCSRQKSDGDRYNRKEGGDRRTGEQGRQEKKRRERETRREREGGGEMEREREMDGRISSGSGAARLRGA
jgi:hypothetical protein